MKILLTEALRQVAEEVDRHTALSAENSGMTPSCERGCHHCCRQLALTSTPEMLGCLCALGERRFRQRWRENKAMYERQLELLAAPHNVSCKSWFLGQHDCFFLHDNECLVYSNRPVACRTHVSLSPAERCAANAPDPTMVVLRVSDIRTWAIQMHADIAEKLGLLSLGSAPIPIAMDVAVAFWSHGVAAANEMMRRHGIDTAEGTLARWGHIEGKVIELPLHVSASRKPVAAAAGQSPTC